MWWIINTCILFLDAGFYKYFQPVVEISDGVIIGQTLQSRDGRDYYSFTGIPYAKPPIGQLRFKPPAPLYPWDGVLDATKEASMCTQNNHFFLAFKNVIHGQEDCLYLNVFTPNLNRNGRLPVMFWIHGGGFLAGHGGSSVYGPDYFMDKDVVLVTFNYRLGLFGFLSTEDDVIPGNYGMKDQVMALRWVQKNIAKFGGNPRKVTIFGESAGSASTGYHLLSPMSKGLFHKAILQSGTPMCRWAVSPPGLIRQRTEVVATIAGCHDHSSEEILNCLKKLPAPYLVELHNKFFEWINHPSILFTPVVEPCDSNQEAFLCNNPITDFKQQSNVPTLIGLNSDEGGIFAAPLFNETSLKYPELNSDFNRILGSLLTYKHLALPEDWDEIADRVMEEYFPFGRIEDHSHSDVVDLIGEGTFLPCVMDMSSNLSSPVYFYLFGYQNEFSFNQMFSDSKKSLGVSHGDELISLFRLEKIFPQGLNEQDTEVSKLMIDIWVKFASSKAPTVDGTDNGLAWPVFTSVEQSSIVHIDSLEPNIIKNPFVEKYKFWSELPLFSRLNKLTSPSKFNITIELPLSICES